MEVITLQECKVKELGAFLSNIHNYQNVETRKVNCYCSNVWVLQIAGDIELQMNNLEAQGK